MDAIIAQLFAARDIAHLLHLKVKSFAQHMALGDLYEGLLEFADDIAEIYQGKYGVMDIKPLSLDSVAFSKIDPVVFILDLNKWAVETRSHLDDKDTNIVNEWDSLISLIYKIKYKLENLK